MTASLTLHDLAISLPDGTPLFSGLSLSVASERVGIVGRNGNGKSTLLRRIASGDAPTSGSINRVADCLLLEQLPPDRLSVAEALGAAGEMSRLERIDEGGATEGDLSAADWTLPERMRAALAAAGLTGLDPHRHLAELSGGERVRVCVARAHLARPALLLLDEPTNDLDADGRALIRDLVRSRRGATVVASHDRELLEEMDRIVELSPIGCHIVGGGWSAFEAERDARRERAGIELERASEAARQTSQAIQRQRERKARRDRAGRAYAAKDIEPRMYLHAQSQRAERTAARDTDLGERLAAEAEARAARAREDVEVVTPLRIDLPTSGLPSERRLIEFDGVTFGHPGAGKLGPWSFVIRGPERVALVGPNGSGKSTILQLAKEELAPEEGRIQRSEARIGFLDQHVTLLDLGRSVVDNIRGHNPELTVQEAHAVAARLGFRAAAAGKTCSVLSGGERMRAALACITGGRPSAQLLLLDEPTNHLDLDAVEMLEHALRSYDGALLVASHDQSFLERVGITRSIDLEKA